MPATPVMGVGEFGGGGWRLVVGISFGRAQVTPAFAVEGAGCRVKDLQAIVCRLDVVAECLFHHL